MEKQLHDTPLNDVFISYSRRNLEFAYSLHKRLVDDGFRVWFDQVSIPHGVDFQNQIDDGIEKAHNFVFIISPHSVNSPYCLKEIERAVLRKKRIIPILHQELAPEDFGVMHPMIGKINWIYARENQDDLDKAFQSLGELLHKHYDYVAYSTTLLLLAAEWDQNQRKSSYLLLGNERQKAENWMLRQFVNEQAPIVPTDLHCMFIAESKKHVMGYQSDAYLSYTNADAKLSEHISMALIRKGLTVWERLKDTPAGEDQTEAIREGIENADSFLFFITEKSIEDLQCLSELDYAESLNKRLIPLMLEKVDRKRLPEPIQNIQAIDFTDNVSPEAELPAGIKSDFDRDIDALLLKINDDRAYYQNHKSWLSLALKWKREGENPGVLAHGNHLQEGLNWLKIARKHKESKPLDIHSEFLTTSEKEAPNQVPQVFIAYDAADHDFASMLNRELQSNGRITWFDHEHLDAKSYHEDITKGIESSENFLFIASRTSCNSERLIEQALYASQLNKRIITLQYTEDIVEDDFPKILQKTPSINFTLRKGDFKAKFSEVIRTLDVDREYIKNHNKWAKLALAWQEKDKSSDLLLRGTEFNLADAWLLDALEHHKKPKPSKLQIDLVESSREAIYAEQLREKRNQKRLKRALVAAIALLVLALGFGGLAILQTFEATQQAQIAKDNAAKAIKNEERAKRNADRAKEEADRANREKERANEERTLARQAEAEALQNFLKAQAAEKEARKQTQLAIEEGKRALAQKKRADYQTEIARLQTKLAEQNSKKAEIEKEKAYRLKELAEARELAFKSIQSFNSAEQREVKALIALYAYDNYKQNQSPDAPQDPDIYSALRLAFEKLDDQNSNEVSAKQGSIRSLMVSPKGEKLFTSGSDGSIKLWEVTPDGLNAEQVRTLRFAKSGIHLTKNIALSNDKNFVASAHNDQSIRIWYIGEGDNPLSLPKKGKDQYIELKGHEYPVKSVAFAPNDLGVLSLDTEGNLRYWPLNTENKRAESFMPKLPEGYDVVSIATHPKYDQFIIAYNYQQFGEIGLFDPQSSSPLQPIIKKINPVQNLSISPDGNMLGVGSRTGSLRLYTFPEPYLIRALNSHQSGILSLSFSPDNRYLVTASFDKTIQIYNLYNLEANPIVISQNQWTYAVDFHPNSKQFFTSGEDERIHIFNTESDQIAENLRRSLSQVFAEKPERKEKVEIQLQELFKGSPEDQRAIQRLFLMQGYTQRDE